MLTQVRARQSATKGAQVSRYAPPRRTPGICQVLGAGRLQPKLKIGAVNDPAEAEADRVADVVMRMPEPASGLSTIAQNSGEIRRKCVKCEEEAQTKPAETVRRMEEDEEIMTKAQPGGPDRTGATAAAAAVSSGGAPLPSSLRSFFEPRFGRDFSTVRLHTSSDAESAAKSINARAYSLGHDIAFGPGQYAPASAQGKKLIAHELTHTVQQSKARATQPRKPAQPARRKLGSEGTCGPSIQRNCSQDEAFHRASPNFCRDDTWSPITHSGKTCYREITSPSGTLDCPPGEHVCFDGSGGCESSPDRSSLADTKQADGSCSWRPYCVLEHIAVDVVPAVLSDHFEKIGRQQIECVQSCRDLPWYLRGFCLQGCSGTMPMR